MRWKLLLFILYAAKQWKVAEAVQNQLFPCAHLVSQSSDELLHCVNASNSSPQARTKSSSVCIITRITSDIKFYGAYSYFVQTSYSLQNGYRMLSLFPDSTTDDYQYHRKLVPIFETMEDNALHCNILVWFDAGLLMILA
jgi:hypothetical protein